MSKRAWFWFDQIFSLFSGASPCDRLSIRSFEETWYTSEGPWKLYRYFARENSWTMSNDTPSRIIVIDVVVSIELCYYAFTNLHICSLLTNALNINATILTFISTIILHMNTHFSKLYVFMLSYFSKYEPCPIFDDDSQHAVSF